MTPHLERMWLYDAVYAESAAMPGFYITLAAIDAMQANAMFVEFLWEKGVRDADPDRIRVVRREGELRPCYAYA